MIDLLAGNPLLLLFTVIGLGYLIGNIDIFGFKLGVAAILFVGIAFGAVNSRFDIPEYIYVLGLVLFVYAIGLQSGPGFFSSFQKRGLKVSALAIGLLLMGALVAVILGKIMGLSSPSTAGLFSGALTNTPALAAAVEMAKSLSTNLSPELKTLYTTGPVVTYGLAYPFGVFGVILWLFLFNKIFKVDIAKETLANLRESGIENIISRTFKIINPAVMGKRVEEALRPLGDSGFVLSRIKKGNKIDVVHPETILEANDVVVAVGKAAAMERARILFGEQMAKHLDETLDGITYRWLFVSNKAVAGKTIGGLQLFKQLHAAITRLRRGDVEFVSSPNTTLELGDRIRVVSHRDNMEKITDFFGDSVKSISETDFLSLSMGIVIGVFLGMIPIPLPNGLTFKLGFAGGPLIAGLILGRLERTGPINWGIPFNANLVLRQVGLVFFLSAIGTKAGHSFSAIFQTGGWGLIAAGGAITTVVTIGTILVGYKYLKLPMIAVMGMMSGIQTQPACLAYATQQTESELPNIWYATVYPASTVTKIFLAQIIVSTMLLLF
ncbi:MAG: transporter [candidate division Zixibacteria bacterium]|nr:transporter [candidate division Zixibacteria bacterium]